MAQGGKSLLARVERTGQVGKLGATFRGSRFSDCADVRGLQTCQKARPDGVTGKIICGDTLTEQQENAPRHKSHIDIFCPTDGKRKAGKTA